MVGVVQKSVTCAVEPQTRPLQIKDTIQITSIDAPIMNIPIVVIPPKRGQPLCSGQNNSSKRVHHLEVLLCMQCLPITMLHEAVVCVK